MKPGKLKSLEEAVSGIPDGSMVGIGGWIFNAQPVALVRALIRKGARDLRLMPAPGSIAPDLLIGAGCVSSTSCLFISFEHYGLAPHFRRRAEDGTLAVSDIDGPGIMAGLRAAICDLPYMPIPDLGTDLPKYAPQQYRPLPTQPGERKLLASMAIRPDVCLIHAQQADEYGNVQHVGPPFLDTLLAQASRHVIVSVDRIVSTQTIRRNNHLTKIPASMVEAIVEAPYGAHPTASPSLYRADEDHLKEYVRACANPEAFATYTERYVHAPGHADYLNAIGGARLAGIAASETNLA